MRFSFSLARGIIVLYSRSGPNVYKKGYLDGGDSAVDEG